MQYLEMGDFYDCYVIGRYDATRDDLSFALLDANDPSKGVSMTYPQGDKCGAKGTARTATMDVQCANTKTTVVSAQEPTPCNYHLVLQSYYGCPTVRFEILLSEKLDGLVDSINDASYFSGMSYYFKWFMQFARPLSL